MPRLVGVSLLRVDPKLRTCNVVLPGIGALRIEQDDGSGFHHLYSACANSRKYSWPEFVADL